VKILIEHGAAVNSSANYTYASTPLQLAAENGNIEIVKQILIHSADVNAAPNDCYGATALQFAAIGGYVGVAKLLLENHADVDFPLAILGGRTALEAAAEHGRLDMVQLLINWGADVTGPGQQQYDRAVELAKSNGHMALSRVLERYHAWSSTFLGQGDFQLLDNLVGMD
ncbi:ankyrin, partial [Zopfia rhizophila CBS 207.26]